MSQWRFTFHRRGLAAIALAATNALSLSAFADPYPVPVRIEGTDPDATYTIRRGAVTKVKCHPPCVVALSPGKYELVAAETERATSGTRTFEVDGPSTLRVQAYTDVRRTVGILTGVLGVAMTAVGGILIHAGLNGRCGGGDICVDGVALGVGVGLAAHGPSVATMGFVMSARREPKIRVRLTPRAATKSHASVRISPSAFGLHATF